VYGSRFLPRLLGVWLAIDGLAWVILSLTGILLPQYYDKVFTYAQPASFGEVAFMLWLVIKGARSPALDATASSTAASQSEAKNCTSCCAPFASRTILRDTKQDRKG